MKRLDSRLFLALAARSSTSRCCRHFSMYYTYGVTVIGRAVVRKTTTPFREQINMMFMHEVCLILCYAHRQNPVGCTLGEPSYLVSAPYSLKVVWRRHHFQLTACSSDKRSALLWCKSWLAASIFSISSRFLSFSIRFSSSSASMAA